jgi:signal transduction histidine kinase
MLLDVMMPKLNGFDVCRVLRQRFTQEDLPILFLTAKGQGDDAVLGLNVGGNDYLGKPFARNELLARLKLHFMLSHGHRLLKEQHDQLDATHKQLVKQEKLAGLGLLSAGVAHEINNPNNFINLSADSAEAAIGNLATFINDLMDDDDSADLRREFTERFDKINQHLRLVKEGSHRIAGIVQGMRSVSRSDADQRRPFKPADGLLSTVELVKTTYKHVAEFDTAGVAMDGAQVNGYASQVNQVFMNLMVNGCQAIEEKLRSDGRQQEKGLLTLGTRTVGDEVLITIADNGCGMPEEIKARLFEPFFTTKGVERGTGLGMGICRGIIDDHQGRIEFSSQPGVGTTVTVALPIHRD